MPDALHISTYHHSEVPSPATRIAIHRINQFYGGQVVANTLIIIKIISGWPIGRKTNTRVLHFMCVAYEGYSHILYNIA